MGLVLMCVYIIILEYLEFKIEGSRFGGEKTIEILESGRWNMGRAHGI